MKLYYSRGACSLVVRIVIHEINIACEFEAVDLQTKKTANGDDFLKINSKGAVPTLRVDNNIVLTENAVILQYLADTHKAKTLLPTVGDFERYRVLECLNFITTEIHKGFSPLFNSVIPQTVKTEIFIPNLEKKFTWIENRLVNSYLMGDHFTLPDAYLFVMLLWCKNFNIDISKWKNVACLFGTLIQRTAIQKALSEEGIRGHLNEKI